MVKIIHPNNPAMRSPQFAKSLFEGARVPMMWLYVGRGLRSSADTIFGHEGPIATRYANEWRRLYVAPASEPPLPLQKFDYDKFPQPNFDGLHLLIGLAIENFLKGMCC
jgi:hypothetical protein